MPEAVFVFDDQGKVIEVNSAAAQMFGMTADEIKKSSAHDISTYLAEQGQDRAREDMVVKRALHGDTVRQERETHWLAAREPGGGSTGFREPDQG